MNKRLNQRDKIMIQMYSDCWIGGDILNKISFQYHTRIWELENKHNIKFESRWKKNDKGECIFKEYKLIPTMESSEYINNLK